MPLAGPSWPGPKIGPLRYQLIVRNAIKKAVRTSASGTVCDKPPALRGIYATPARQIGWTEGRINCPEMEDPVMKLPLIALAAAVAATATGPAFAQPPGRGPGLFGLLEFDADADGRLTRNELDTAQRNRFNAIDTNRDGTATADEFRAFHEAQGEARRAETLKARFDRLDADGNGQISSAEFAARPGHDKRPDRHGGPGRHKGPGPGRMAADADRSVSFDDFSARGVEAFARADANKDGVVTIVELQALRPRGR